MTSASGAGPPAPFTPEGPAVDPVEIPRDSDRHGREIHHELWRDIVRYVPAVILPRLTGILTVPILTRLFPPEIMGTYILVLANVAALGSAFLSGFGASLLRFLPEREADPVGRGRLATTLFAMAAAIAFAVVLAGAAVLALTGRTSKRFGQLMVWGLLLFAATGVLNLLAVILRSGRHLGRYTTIQLVSGYGGVGLGLLLVLVFHAGIAGMLMGSTLAALLGIGLAWPLAMQGRALRPGLFDPRLARELLGFAFFISMGNAAYWLLSLSDRWLLRVFRGAEDVGLYGVSYDITSKTTMLFVTAFGLALQPLSIAAWEARGREATEAFLASSTRTYLLVMLPATVGLSLLARALVGLLAAPAYQPGAVVVPFVAAAMFLYGLLDIAGRGLTLNKRPDLEARNFLIAGVVSVLLNLLLIPRFGILAAAAVTAIGYLTLLLMHAATVQRHVRWRFPWATLVRSGFACAAMAVVVLVLKGALRQAPRGVDVAAAAVGGAAAYGIVIVALGELSPRRAARALWSAVR